MDTRSCRRSLAGQSLAESPGLFSGAGPDVLALLPGGKTNEKHAHRFGPQKTDGIPFVPRGRQQQH